MQCGKIVISGETGVGQVLVRKIFALWFLCVLALQSSAWAQRHGHARYRPGHFGARHPSFYGRAPGFPVSHPGYRPGLVYRFPSHRPYRFSPNYGAFRHYRPYQYYHGHAFYSFRPDFNTAFPFSFAIAPYPYRRGFIDPYWPGVGFDSRYPLVEERPRVTGPEREKERSPTERMWLLALNDGSIRAVRDHWLEDDTLQYLTRDGKSASVPLSELDLTFTLQLNRERGLDFRLPKPPAD